MLKKIIEILTELHSDVDYENTTSLIDDGILDSFDIVSLVGDLNDEFDIEITVDHLLPENFNSAEAICNLVKALSE